MLVVCVSDCSHSFTIQSNRCRAIYLDAGGYGHTKLSLVSENHLLNEIQTVQPPQDYQDHFDITSKKKPTCNPTGIPTIYPTIVPSALSTVVPSLYPTIYPSIDPSADPTTYPTSDPSNDPTIEPTAMPTDIPPRYIMKNYLDIPAPYALAFDIYDNLYIASNGLCRLSFDGVFSYLSPAANVSIRGLTIGTYLNESSTVEGTGDNETSVEHIMVYVTNYDTNWIDRYDTVSKIYAPFVDVSHFVKNRRHLSSITIDTKNNLYISVDDYSPIVLVKFESLVPEYFMDTEMYFAKGLYYYNYGLYIANMFEQKIIRIDLTTYTVEDVAGTISPKNPYNNLL